MKKKTDSNPFKKEIYISLKEAAKISGYSPDYIGQLIREGKIWGKPVYTNIAWRTTAEEVLKYKNKKKNRGEKNKVGLEEKIRLKKAKFFHYLSREAKIFKLFFETFRFAIPLIVILILSFSLLIGYLFSWNTRRNFSVDNQQEQNIEQDLRY